ncbi:hypothetical protein A0H81_11707 [Grifola frondosa]|uniref:Uncharacterized protein n=1 Tax=Grifola frondosa TaxID=5627 RepID=A0A1C7LVV5_GRIFR|nr:hypothetical protein A0H81_11707 [Grifola frondosa]
MHDTHHRRRVTGRISSCLRRERNKSSSSQPYNAVCAPCCAPLVVPPGHQWLVDDLSSLFRDGPQSRRGG